MENELRSIFNEFDKFMMFNHTSPSSGFGFRDYFNCDVRYYPHTMSQETWDKALECSDPWEHEWDFEQILYNKMLWSQNIQIQEAHRPDLAFQDVPEGKNKDRKMSDAKIIHFHGSRQIRDVIKKVNELKGAVQRASILYEIIEGALAKSEAAREKKI